MHFLNNLFQTFLSLLKIALKSNFRLIKNKNDQPSNSDIIILGNGPSGVHKLIDTFKNGQRKPFMAVNMFASTKYFSELKPDYYLVSDHAFFTFSELEFQNKNMEMVKNKHQELKQYQLLINAVWENIFEAKWPITILMPSIYKDNYIVKLALSKNIQFRYFNYVVLKGFDWFENYCYQNHLGSPQCQNVINNCIFESVQMNFKNIYLVGVENNFHINTFVDNDNHLKQKDDHFYEVKHKIVPISHANGTPVKIHEFFLSLHKAFYAHHRLQKYAIYRNVNIYNATQGSFIDAYPRKEIQFN